MRNPDLQTASACFLEIKFVIDRLAYRQGSKDNSFDPGGIAMYMFTLKVTTFSRVCDVAREVLSVFPYLVAVKMSSSMKLDIPVCSSGCF